MRMKSSEAPYTCGGERLDLTGLSRPPRCRGLSERLLWSKPVPVEEGARVTAGLSWRGEHPSLEEGTVGRGGT